MKKVRLILLFVVALLIPVMTFAEAKPDHEFKGDEKEVKVYFFHGDGCSHCAEAEAWFKEIEDEYGDKFEVVPYEVWSNEENATLMEDIGKFKEQEVEGVPYILVEEKAWNGFDQSYVNDILAAINEAYEKDVADRYDILDYVSGKKTEEDNTTASVIALIAIILVLAGSGTGIYFARKGTK